MVSVLDDEYVLEMDEVPPFSWLSKSHERVMHCNPENYYELGEKISKLSPSSLTEENLAKTVALELKDKIPVIVYDYSSYAIARKLQEDLLQNSNLFSILISYNQIKMTNNIGDNYKVIEIAEHRMKVFDSSIFLEFKGGLDSIIFFSTLTSYISLYSALLKRYDFYLFDILKE